MRFIYNCTHYQAIYQAYYDKTCPHLSVRFGKHSGVSPLTGKKSKSKKSHSIKRPYVFVIILHPLMTLKF